MTEQFEKWAQQILEDHITGMRFGDKFEEGHAWLSAFVKEVERRCKLGSFEINWLEIVRDFGLESKP